MATASAVAIPASTDIDDAEPAIGAAAEAGNMEQGGHEIAAKPDPAAGIGQNRGGDAHRRLARGLMVGDRAQNHRHSRVLVTKRSFAWQFKPHRTRRICQVRKVTG